MIFLHFLLETASVICSGKRLPALAESGNWHTATNSFELIPTIINSSKPISAIS
jgi:hypothetical protein